MTTPRKTITESSYPYSKAEIRQDNDTTREMVESLFDLLPHGSGIDYTWSIIQHSRKNNVFYISNAYHAMDEYGGYCHTYDFTFTIEYDNNKNRWDIIRLNFHGQREYNCCGYDLKDYLYQTIELSLHP